MVIYTVWKELKQGEKERARGEKYTVTPGGRNKTIGTITIEGETHRIIRNAASDLFGDLTVLETTLGERRYYNKRTFEHSGGISSVENVQ